MQRLRYVLVRAVLAVLVFLALAENALAQSLTLKQTYVNPTPASDAFGFSVAGLGNNVLIGAPLDDAGAGAVYLFDGATGSLLQTFMNPGPDAGDQFGFFVAAVGSNVLIGAPFDDNGATDAGAAYLFDGATGALLQTFLNPAPVLGDQFGFRVASAGGNALIGTPFSDISASDDGVVYLFDSVSGTLLQTFLDPTPAIGDQFGASITGVGSNVLIGAPFDDTGASDAGAAYLMDGATGSLLLTILNPTPAISDQFGSAVAASGSTLAIAAHLDNTGATDAGAVYLFDGASGALLRTFTNPTPANGDQFGFSISAMAGNVIIVGARQDDTGATNAGSAYSFDGNTGALLQTFNNPAPVTGDQFGFSVAGIGSSILVGTPLNDTGATNSGSAYLYGPSNAPPLANAGVDQTIESTSPAGAQVTLDGSASSDPDLDVLTYTWHENSVIIAGPTTSATSVATLGLGVHIIELIVDDGNDANDTDEVIITIVDTAPPVITLNGANPLTIECHSGAYTDPGATVTDVADPTPSLVISGVVDVNVPGAYIVTFTATDASGNSASTTRTVNVIDTTPPVLTLNGDNPMTLQCHVDSYTELGATVSDACDAAATLVISGAVNANTVGVYTVTYTVTDASGNSASATRTVNVVDTLPPVITLNGDNPMTLECPDSYTEPGAVVSDACDPSPSLVISGSVNANVPGAYALAYTATDASGNSASTTRTVNVECPLPHPFVLLASVRVKVDRQLDSEGDIHSNNDIEFRDGNPSTHTGNLTAVDDITIRSCNTIDGNVAAGDDVTRENNVTITGTVTSNAPVEPYPLPTFSFTAGTKNVTVYQYQSLSLAPGSYHDVNVGYRGNLALNHNGSSGKYFFYELDLDNFAKISIDVSNGPVEINMVRKFHFDKDVKVIITPAVEGSSKLVTFNTMGTEDMHIHERSNVSGSINAPKAEVILYPSAFFKGAVAAKEITVQCNATFLHHNSSSSSVSSKVSTSTAEDVEESTVDSTSSSTGEEVTATTVKSYELGQNYPNPFNPETEIRFAVPETGRVTVKIFNTLGEEIRTLVDGDYATGLHVVRWNGQNYRGEKVPSGVYFYQMITPRFKESKKMLLAK